MKAFFKKNDYVFIVAMPFILMPLVALLIGYKIDYVMGMMILPNVAFTLAYISLIVGLTLLLKGFWGKLVYIISFIICFVMLIANCVYVSFTGYYFSFNLVLMASEGGEYIGDAILSIKLWMIPLLIIVLVSFIYGLKYHRKPEKWNFKVLAIIVVAFAVIKISAPMAYGKGNSDLGWDTWRNPRNVYENFYDANKNFRVCGFYEYLERDFYVTFLRTKEADDPAELAYLDDAYSVTTPHPANSKTGILSGKNVIFLQLEGMDDWLLNETDTPNLYALMKEGLNFNDHYAFYTGGGSTFNSELAVNTGFITPVTYIRNAYTFNTNTFKYSMPNKFKELGYRVNAFHMNTSEYYSRGINYQSWGYDRFNSLIDDYHYSDKAFLFDRELVENEGFYEKMFKGEEPFVHYIITYTPHMPFSTEDYRGEVLAKEKGITEKLSEEDSARLYVGETDKMVGELIQALKDNNLYENTVIVAYADHYVYTFSTWDIQRKHKDIYTNLVNHTPFFIWSYGLEGEEVTKANSQIDILPTVLNLFGIEYDEENYIGHDIFDDTYSGYVFFADYSWYDGNIYVVDGKVEKGTAAGSEEVKEKGDLISDAIRRNDLTLKYDYFKSDK